jgi:hypothetical protein
MNTYSAHHTAGPAVAGRAGRRFHRVVGFLIAATAGLASFGLAGPAAFAMLVPPGGDATGSVAPTVTVISTGVAVWQVALIAAGAALLGAVVVLQARRLRPARGTASSPAA